MSYHRLAQGTVRSLLVIFLTEYFKVPTFVKTAYLISCFYSNVPIHIKVTFEYACALI